ncbi:DUF1127 domain-containing protein [Aliiroseovarius sp. F20344]|uniref:DUF1127 domain-containing protein n=1 Tax=Aliiroseovarius sp. F20344 TaxID=2926414 RepID=UPI001FF187A2|nr:DUF1127 domain-containing protein [Aliiroseovarius sp. F20344]MCK0142348.1 DUF1127 domain-containing protein [Aliiroseovarius sp. F20344]
MAAFDTMTTATGGVFGGRLSDAMRGMFSAVVAWNDARETRNALLKLTDRELEDIGLCRADIVNL